MKPLILGTPRLHSSFSLAAKARREWRRKTWGTFRQSRDVQGFLPTIAAAAAKIQSGVAGGACPASVSATGVRASGRPGFGLFRGGRDCRRPAERGRTAGQPPHWVGGGSPRSGAKRNVRGGAWRGATQKRFPRPTMTDTGTCVQKAPGPPGGGAVYYGALFVTRYDVRTGKGASIIPGTSDRPGRLRRQGHNGGPADLYCQASARSVSGVSERGVPDVHPGRCSRLHSDPNSRRVLS